ncbi:MAG: AI-2E family transporter [Anaerolineae bacterium]
MLFGAVMLLVALVLWRARGALLPFLVGIVVAYLLAPPVDRLHAALPARLRDSKAGRPLTILAVYIAAIAFIAGFAALVAPTVVRQAEALLQSAPDIYQVAQARFQQFVLDRPQLWSEQSQALVERLLGEDVAQRAALAGLEIAQRGGLATVGAVSSTVSWALAFIVVPIWVVYVLNDSGRMLSGGLGLIPSTLRPDVEAARIVTDEVLSGYIRGQLVIAIVLGAMSAIALFALGVPYALLLGVVAAALGLIPFVGAILGMIPAVIVALGQSVQLALLVVAAFLVVQLIDNVIVSPRVQGDAVALHPALIMVVLVVGQQLMGPLGLLVAVPLTALLRDWVHYIYLRLGDDRPSPAQALATIGYERADPISALE